MPKKNKKFWNLVKNETEKSADLILYGDIGTDDFWNDITDKQFKEELMNLGDLDTIEIYINSPGGVVYAALAIANTIKSHNAKVIANIEGLAASAATIITCACDKVRMAKNSLFMIHNPWGFSIGEQKDMEKSAEVLSKWKDSILETYAMKSKLDKKTLSEMMDKETWLNAEEAKSYGFVDEIIGEEADVKNMSNILIVNNLAVDISKFKNFPQKEKVETSKNKLEEKITEDFLEKEHKDIYDSIKQKGIEEERNRLQEIDSLDCPDKDLVLRAKYKEPMNVKEFSYEIVKSGKFRNKNILENMIVESQQTKITSSQNPGTGINGSISGVSLNSVFKFMKKKGE